MISGSLVGHLTLYFTATQSNQMLHQLPCLPSNRIIEEPVHSEWCVGPFSLAISAVVPVSNLICTILYPLPVGHRRTVTAEQQQQRQRRIWEGEQVKRHNAERGKGEEKEIKRSRINSQSNTQRQNHDQSGLMCCPSTSLWLLESYLMNEAEGFNKSLVARWSLT